ncbi:MAG: Vms1/Ankzf1 family peptidyl-tRNA hydrolase [Chloroflexota bacterium]|nr:Vms1/Ankzf1 family peptidyl-tRNA hydrolase [Chloroflexota bacterium]MDE2941573.1 Vms1/Ankzf1 family peptidyl-tRNA hydrolase [Chloroflexota bacterium]MDE3268054.1 Vms1/Ankzf1 family peptidyl-tRNA hydrolase [Chloroflexota bacterium]
MEQRDVAIGPIRSLAAAWHNPTRSGRTYYLPPGAALPHDAALDDSLAAAITNSGTGAVMFWSADDVHAVLPPFPVEAAAEFDGWDTGPLMTLLDRHRTVLVLLLRLSGFAVGVFEGERLVQSKIGSRFVKARHKKGGSSSGRFARRREGQARALMDKAAETFQAQAEVYDGSFDHLLLGGDRMTLLAFRKRCTYLERLESIRLPRVLNVDDPKLETLRTLPRLIYTSRVVSSNP